MNNKVAILECVSYDRELLFNTLKKLCSESEMPDVKDKTVLVKPNILSDAQPQDCITTHPNVVWAVIKILKENGAKNIIVGDSPGLHTTSFSAKKCGIFNVCEETGAEWVDFTSSYSIKKIPGTKQTVPVTNFALTADIIISVCKFKTHQLMYTTGAVKNLFGTIPSVNKSKCHLTNPTRESFARLITGLHQLLKPSFCIMDAVIGMEGAGPANGTPRAVNMLMASSSCIAMDMAQAIIMGYKTSDIPIIREFTRQGLAPSFIEYPLLDANKIIINDFEKVKVREKTNFIRTLVFPLLTRSMQKKKQQKQPAPSFDSSKCIHCLRCVNICPASALKSNENSKITIDVNKCIRCYCCHEMCPNNAILIEK